MKFVRATGWTASVFLVVCSVCAAGTTAHARRNAPVAKSAFTARQLEKLTRALKLKNPAAAYAQLSAFALQKPPTALRMRAALALGYFDYSNGKYAQAGNWFARAKGDPLLGDYARYWIAENDLAQARSADALDELEKFCVAYPDSVMMEQALQALGEAAIAANQPVRAVTALDAYPLTTQRPALLFLRAEANEKAGQTPQAAADYQTVYTRFAVSEQGREAGRKLDFLRSNSGVNIPALSLSDRIDHAALLFDAKDWDDASDEYAAILPELTGADRERAQLRILECGLAKGAGPAEMIALSVSDPDVDAERLHSLAEFYRTKQQETEMVAAIEAAAQRAPNSQWAELALFLAGNYYWTTLDRDRAAGYYKRLEENFPTAPDAVAAQWRVAWTAVLKREADDTQLLQEHLRRFPGSPYTPDALYWLGRLAEEAGTTPLARSYYTKLETRYPHNYFGNLGSDRLRSLGPGEMQVADVLQGIPAVVTAPKFDNTIPPAAAKRQARADALRSIGFDASSELELRAGYAATHAPILLLEAAQAAVGAGHYGAAIVTVCQIFPQLDAAPFSDVPRDVWLAAYALPFETSIRRWSAASGIDPMLVAGLIHQESAFDPEARSSSNAIGLMQLIPPTARRLAVQGKLHYARYRLTDPDYNVRLGTAYLANLQKQFGGVEAVLAAYNAGEDRVMSWTAGQNYREAAEFVDSIPFTETRQYVEIVSRNADIYRRLYGEQHESRTVRTDGGH